MDNEELKKYQEFKELTPERVNDDKYSDSYRDCLISVVRQLKNGSLVGLSVEWAGMGYLTTYFGELFQEPEQAVNFARKSIDAQWEHRA